MNKMSQWRMSYGQYVAQAYSREPKVAAVMVSGSTARGHADEYSDVELGIFWEEPPTDDDRMRIMNQIDADNKRRFPFDAAEHAWFEDYIIGRAAPKKVGSGQFVEVMSVTSAHFEQILHDVVVAADADEQKQNMIAGVLHGIAVKGGPLLQQWQAAAAVYPDALATAVVHSYGQIDHYWRCPMWVARDNHFMLRQQLWDVQRRVLHMLLAINRRYYFGFKWLDQLVAQCDHTPADFLVRFRVISQQANLETAAQLRELVEETYTLVEKHVPNVDAERLRTIFRWQRPTWGEDGPPVHAL